MKTESDIIDDAGDGLYGALFPAGQSAKEESLALNALICTLAIYAIDPRVEAQVLEAFRLHVRDLRLERKGL